MRIWPEAVWNWGTTAAERERRHPCDEQITDPDVELFRAVDVEADAPTTFRWLCQLRAAPYSYDLLDNRGSRSPAELTPGLEQLELGQRFMKIFELVAFEPGRSITLRHEGAAFGTVVVTYDASPAGSGRSRLFAKIAARRRSSLRGALTAAVLPAGDLVMMRRQLLNLKRLAERTAPGPRA